MLLGVSGALEQVILLVYFAYTEKIFFYFNVMYLLRYFPSEDYKFRNNKYDVISVKVGFEVIMRRFFI